MARKFLPGTFFSFSSVAPEAGLDQPNRDKKEIL
jgi:hypothetical protein